MAVRTPFLIVLISATAAAGEPDPKKDPEWVGTVHEAIDRGVAWLLSHQQANGQFPAFTDARGDIYPLGMHALATLAVIKGGQPLDTPPAVKALRALHNLYETHQFTLKTYEAGLTLMALEAKYFSVPPRAKGKKPPAGPKFDPADVAWAKKVALWIQTKQQAGGMWRYPEEGEDLSNTQYAVLGLWSARRLGLDVDKGVVRRMIETVMARQQADGPKVKRVLLSPDPRYGKWVESASQDRARGWRYMPDYEQPLEGGKVRKIVYPYSGSMTSAGIACLAIGRELLGSQDPWLTPTMDG
ncbi:MAG: hypothetical protein ACREID_08785, partial [Planctomycetota bacterium]